MQNENSLGLEQLLTGKLIKRRKLIPVLVKIFIWIFIVFACFIPLILLIQLLGVEPSMAIYGLETSHTYSIVGLVICFLFLFKGITAYALWAEKTWAVKLAIVEAIIGIMICSAVMMVPLFKSDPVFTFRFELVALIPYLAWLFKIKDSWEQAPTDFDN